MSLGTLAINNNSDQVTGTNTSFTVDLKVNDFIAVPSGGVTYTMVVKAIASDTALTITRPFSGPNVTGANWAAIPAGTMVGVTAKIADDTAYTMRMYVNEANNWMSLLTIDGDVTVYAPDGSDYTGPSWLKLGRFMNSLDMAALTTLAAQIHADAIQVAADTQTTSANTATATQAAQTATTAAQTATDQANTATTKAGEASASAITAKNEADRAATANPDNQLKKDNNLSDVVNLETARTNMQIDRVTQGQTYSALMSANKSNSLVLNDAGLWGMQQGSTWIPLAVTQGGTGGNNQESACSGIGTMFVKLPVSTYYGPASMETSIGYFDTDRSPYPGGGGAPFSYAEIMTIAEFGESGNFSQIAVSVLGEAAPRYRQRFNTPARLTDWRDFLVRGLNTIADTNGFYKTSSPIIKIWGDGTTELNSESEGATVVRVDTGVYKVSGVMGFNSSPEWGGADGGYSVPQNGNGLPLLWLDFEIAPDGDITIRTFHRTHSNAPEFARNLIGIKNEDGSFTETVKDGDPVDIPAGRWIDLRVEMPQNSIWYMKQQEAQEARDKAERER